MKIWVDADACPKIIKEILYRVANRTQLSVMLIANKALYIPPSPYIKMQQVGRGFDVADKYIVQNLTAGDLVITADIPLADEIVTKGGTALSPRGQLFTEQNIKQFLTIRNFHDELRGSGIHTRGVDTLSQKEIQAFSNGLDRFIHAKKGKN